MNKTILIGRLTRDPEIRQTNGGGKVAKFAVAVTRKFKNSTGGYDADFINCTAFGNTADFIAKFFQKGMCIGLVGRLQTNTYENSDGKTVYSMDVVAEEVEFVGNKNSSEATGTKNENASKAAPVANEAADIENGDEDDLPF